MQMIINGETINYSYTDKTDRMGKTRRYFRSYVTLSTDPVTGHKETKEVIASSEVQFREKITALQHTRPLDAGATLPFKIYLEKWLHSNILRYRASTYEQSEYYFNRYLEHGLNEVVISDITEDLMIDFYSTILDLFGESVAYDLYKMLQKPFKDAVNKHIIYENPQENIRLSKPQKKPIIPLSAQEARKLNALASEDDIYGVPIRISLRIGLRISECLGLSITDYNSTTKTVTIHRQLLYSKKKKKYYIENRTKTGAARIISLDDETAKIFDDQLIQLERFKLEAGEDWNNKFNCLFTNRNGRYLQHTTVRNHLKNLCNQIGRKEFKYHHLRHTCATLLLESTGNIKIVQQILGHSRLDSTGIYISASPNKIRDALTSISTIIDI